MADKITNAMNAVYEKLKDLVGSKDLRKMEWGPINPFAQMQLPVASMVLASYSPAGFHWTAEVDLVIVTRVGPSRGRGDDVAEVQLSAKVNGAIDELIAAGTAGAVITRPKWTPFETVPTKENPMAVVGNVGVMTFTVDDPILVG